MFGDQVAMIFGHPGHEYAALGIIQQLRPQILYVTQADSGHKNRGREKLAMDGMSRLGLENQVTFLHLSEPDIQGEALSGKTEQLLGMIEQIRRWIQDVQPNAVFGDAYEHYNFIHDLVRLSIDIALTELDPHHTITNCEVPLAIYGDEEVIKHSHKSPIIQGQQYQFFPLETSHAETKRQIIADAGRISPYMASIERSLVEDVYEQEPYRLRKGPRDYTIQMEVPWKTYDDYGRDRVAAGQYLQPIQFEQHFLPLVEQLCDPLNKAA